MLSLINITNLKITIIKYLCCLVFLTLVQAAGSSIEGTVTDFRSKGPLMGANIMLDGTMLGAASDENGYYIIKNIPIGTYERLFII